MRESGAAAVAMIRCPTPATMRPPAPPPTHCLVVAYIAALVCWLMPARSAGVHCHLPQQGSLSGCVAVGMLWHGTALQCKRTSRPYESKTRVKWSWLHQQQINGKAGMRRGRLRQTRHLARSEKVRAVRQQTFVCGCQCLAAYRQQWVGQGAAAGPRLRQPQPPPARLCCCCSTVRSTR